MAISAAPNTKIARFLSPFDAVFSLNQDLLPERHFHGLDFPAIRVLSLGTGQRVDDYRLRVRRSLHQRGDMRASKANPRLSLFQVHPRGRAVIPDPLKDIADAGTSIRLLSETFAADEAERRKLIRFFG
jgi:hypothetical protein